MNTLNMNPGIIKETILLHHLTVDNRPTSEYVVKFIEFFESDRYVEYSLLTLTLFPLQSLWTSMKF